MSFCPVGVARDVTRVVLGRFVSAGVTGAAN
jgi:hypothetical protein